MNALTNITAAPTAEKVDWTRIDTQVKHEGKEIKLPAEPGKMDYDEAINTIARVRDEENQEFDVHEIVKGAPWDTLVAVYRAMQEIYGVVISEGIKTFFGEIKPDFVTVHTGPGNDDRIQVPMGAMGLPGVSKHVFIKMFSGGTVIQGTVRKCDRARLVEIANKAREIIRSASVYKGKAIRLNVDSDGDLELDAQPEFLDLARVNETDMIHTKETGALIRTNILAPLKFTQECRNKRIPLKRGILLEGKYGTGKSLTSRVTAKVATDNGWTFIMLNRSQGLKAAIEFARTYQPCVIFAEDIDRAADRDDEDVNDLVNLLDGLISKEMEMMVVLTTNHIEKIDRALLRPGRFDAVISIDAPDAETAERIIRTYAGNLLDVNADLSPVGDVTAGMIPASIREVVERAKLSMLTEGRVNLTADDLYISAVGMKRHVALLEPKKDEKTHAEMFAEGLIGLLGDGLAVDVNAASPEDVLDARNKVIKRLVGQENQLAEIGNTTKGGAHAATIAAETGLRILKQVGGE
ncbi:ATP-binding protein [Brucella anthropi]|uniref:AAA ATPase central domain protein n=1 Tax=Brucella anthropi (strain ATCC 49188 / DSM 6882 / CCUG 24695 / JCM 21032 / LMG 3331 / NBRC 15819 / NCTC 12168 / Alc 37) TaxID=439375 RepID=A6WZ59_BRUA4|nr:ATP-binding protein [Brucella anthropi]ABS14263.1 AAA ATPase central domain protein [Brucella anthropi ATCC 49188]QQC25793.1 ATP-binding protein [Brucella anthropi]SUA65405.1 ATP-dependent zinc metalloprotease FtsH [Brucella anthropi]